MTKKKPSYYFKYDACIRITGCGDLYSEITRKTGLSPSHAHLKGDLRDPKSKKRYEQDIWILESPLKKIAKLEKHIDWLWREVSPHKSYFKKLISKSPYSDLCISCRSDCSWPLLGINKESLTILHRLPLSVSFNFTLF